MRRRFLPVDLFPFAIAANFFLAYVFINAYLPLGIGWDFAVYQRAVELRQSGLSGYENAASLNFVYHPYVLELFSIINKFLPFHFVYIAFCAFVIIYLLIELIFLTRKVTKWSRFEMLIIISILFFGFSGSGYLALFSLNIGFFLHLMFWAMILHASPRERDLRKSWFLICVLCASFIKPYFLVYLSVPYVLKWNIRSLPLMIGVLLTGVIWFSPLLLNYSTFQKFLTNVYDATLVNEDLGISLFGIWQQQIGILTSLFLHFLIWLISATYCFYKFCRGKKSILRNSLLIIPLISLNPRLKDYDFAVLILILSVYAIVVLERQAMVQFMNWVVGTGTIFLIGLLNFSGFIHLVTQSVPLLLMYITTIKFLSFEIEADPPFSNSRLT